MSSTTDAPVVVMPVLVETSLSQATDGLCGSVPRRDAEQKVLGAAIYVADIHRPGMLHGKAVRSPHPHALIKGIDASAALALPGVVAVFTAADVPGTNITGARVFKDQPLLAADRVRLAGEAVAVVAAETESLATQGAALVKVTYELLPVVDDPARSLDPESPRLHEQGNLCQQVRIVKGDFESALKQADLVVTNTYRTPMGDHACLEPDGAVAEPDGDGIRVWNCSKGVHVDRGEVARVLGIPLAKVRVIAATIGGSFGSKPDLPTVCMAALIAWKTKRPAKMVLSREEYFLVKTKRHPYVITMTHVVRRDGKILGLKVKALADAGAYSSFTPSVVTRGLVHATGPYVVPSVELEAMATFTNNPITGAFRGYGEPQFCFAVERQLDIIARELGLDPWELRMRNAMRPGDETSTGQVMDCAHMPEIFAAGRRQAQQLDAEDWAAGRLAPVPGCRRAWGMAATFYGLGRTGPADSAEVTLRLTEDGQFHLFIGCPDTGQGSDTGMAQLAARRLGVPLHMVRVTSADTKLTRDAGTTTATRITYIVGNAVVAAAADLQQRLLAEAERLEGLARTGLVDDSAWLARLEAACRGHGVETEAVGRFSTPTSNLDENGQGTPYG
ncbi:MAG: xanthine dehydrogenase family protein molybdopterin-binding subunit, partial [Chloroflexota bacterium]|nr:xanthine dehydrogenase family protein molybdopterin-binding subunit [Chloroflexota bacterium]